ncbi:universal stress protein [Actinomadura bangladeshensis]|uniref:Universal stress protein n=1 Tax=Actinomadura bangladeshensis TaxID=453573 RepID=A0A4R4P5U7_9ACTN|nr:universal stress protein [Actinomadura bangladeshensis]TDC16160.1 universal stress protein [Actinomadura bangladeshensis]
MTACLLLVAEDSPSALDAARYAVDLAHRLGARIRAVNVIADGVLTDAVTRVSGHPDVDGRRDLAGRSVLAHIRHLAGLEDVETETVQRFGDVAECVLDEARRTRPDLIVLGRAGTSPPGGTALAPWARRVLEFAERPVLVVPGGWSRRNPGTP